jgi:hypothetical protein
MPTFPGESYPPRIGRPSRPPIQRARVHMGHLHLVAGPVKSAFCGAETVSCVTGLSIDHVYEMVEHGRFLWVWNVSAGTGARRELRFWSREINDPASVAKLKLDAVINAAVPFRAHVSGQCDGLRNWEFRHLLRLSKPSLTALRQELGISETGRDLFISRAGIEQFFRRRWMGGLKNAKRKQTPDYKTPNYVPRTWY